MRTVYTTHAKKRMLERGVSQEDAELVLSFPDFVNNGRDGTLIASKIIRGKAIRIIYNLEGNNTVVITVC
jgi:hypothetical protein